MAVAPQYEAVAVAVDTGLLLQLKELGVDTGGVMRELMPANALMTRLLQVTRLACAVALQVLTGFAALRRRHVAGCFRDSILP